MFFLWEMFALCNSLEIFRLQIYFEFVLKIDSTRKFYSTRRILRGLIIQLWNKIIFSSDQGHFDTLPRKKSFEIYCAWNKELILIITLVTPKRWTFLILNRCNVVKKLILKWFIYWQRSLFVFYFEKIDLLYKLIYIFSILFKVFKDPFKLIWLSPGFLRLV